jgi:hypothetical protein
MNRALSLVRQNGWTIFMLGFVVAVFTFMAIADQAVKDDEDPQSLNKNRSETAAQLKLKEKIMQEKLQTMPILSATLSLSFLVIFFGGMALDGMILRKKLSGQPWASEATSVAEPNWGVKTVFQAFVFLYFIEALLFVLHIVSTHWDWVQMPTDYYLLVHSLIRNFAVALFVLLMVRRRFKQSIRELGLMTDKWWIRVREGLMGYVAVVPPLICLFLLIAVFLKLFSYEPEPQNVVQIFLKRSTETYLVAFTVFVAIVGPVLEEVFFRGFAYQALKKRWGIWPGAIITSAVFAAFHLNAVAFLPIMFLGLFLTYLYQSTGSLVAPITAHIVHNTIMVALTLSFKGLTS